MGIEEELEKAYCKWIQSAESESWPRLSAREKEMLGGGQFEHFKHFPSPAHSYRGKAYDNQNPKT